MEIEDLFRNKLDNAELTPGLNIRDNLMKKLGRREFLRFNPSRINIYYVGGLIAAGVTVALLIASGRQDGKQRENVVPPSEKIILTDSAAGKSGISVKNTVTKPGEISDLKEEKNKRQEGTNESENSISAVRNTVVATLKPVSENDNQLLKKSEIRDQVRIKGISDISLQRKISASFDASAVSGCVPMRVRFINRSVSYDSCLWTFGDGGFSTENNPEWIFDLQGEYKIVLKVTAADGSQATASLLINAFPKPVARFETDPANPVIPDDEIRFLNTSMDGIRSRWSFGDGQESDEWEPVHKYDRFGNYNLRLVIWSEHGCADSLTVLNAFAGSGSYIVFPNAFIPNPDGPAGAYYSSKSDESAQIFHPVTSGVSAYQLRIFSKIGVLIYESNDINLGWDGYHKGQLCEPGVYVWKVRGTYKNGEPFVKMGDVTLLKK